MRRVPFPAADGETAAPLRWRKCAWLVALGLLSAAAAPTGLAAQSAADWVAEWELKYGSARDSYNAAYQDYQVIENQWGQLLTDYDNAQRAEDDDRIGRLLAGFQNLQGERDRLQSVLNARKEEWYTAYDGLLGSLHAYLDILVAVLERSPVGSQGEEQALYTKFNRRLEEVEVEVAEILGPRQSFEVPPMPDISIREGDSRADILRKARFIDRRVEQLEDVVEGLDREIAYLVRRQRRDRTREDVRAALNVFDDRAVPVVTPPTANTDLSGVTGVGDTTVVNLLRLPLEERLERLSLTREGFIELIDGLKEKSRSFVEAAGRES